MKVYLDNAATTPVAKEVVRAMMPYFSEKYGNASSLHKLGQEAKMALEESRETIARSINARPEEIVFTSGGTESNNLALKGTAFATGKNHIITTKIEHDCIMNSCKWLKTKGFKVSYVDVDKEGFVDLEQLKGLITNNTFLVSVIHGNNEVGTIQNLNEIGKICKENNVYFHSDACQSYTKEKIDVRKQNLTLLTLNAHKIHGPKGVGALYVKSGTKIVPLAHGGGHEFDIRSGTENISGIVGFAKAVKLAKPSYVGYMARLRDMLIKGVLEIPDVMLNGPIKKRLCNNANFSFKYIEGEALGSYLDAAGICTSTGSACSSKSLEPSHVLIAMGLSPEEAHGSLRLSLSRYNTKEEIEYVLSVLPEKVKKLRKISPLGGR